MNEISDTQNMAVQIDQELKTEKDRLISFIQKGYKAKIKWIKNGQYEQVIQSEIAIAASLGRLDIVQNLITRANKINALVSQKEQLDYSIRFSQQEPILLPVPTEEDSTQKED